MTLDDNKIKEIITKRPNKKWITAAQNECKKLLMHTKGVGLDAYIERINQFEKEDLVNIRKKYAISNKYLFSLLHRPLDKIWSAKGGSVYYDMKSEKQQNEMAKYMGNVVKGYSVKKWLKTFWQPATQYDPMSQIFIEINKEGKPYPTYKSILDVFEMELNGREVEYVIYKCPEMKATKEGYFLRVIDDVSDKIVQVNGNNVTVMADMSFPNYFMKVPASITSDIFDPTKGYYISFDDDCIELADQYLTQGSVKNIFKNYVGFPQRWEYQSACPECKGTKTLNGAECTFCKGSGVKSRTDVSEVIRIPKPTTKDNPVIAPDVAGYISPSKDGWELMDGELKLLKNIMHQVLWGTQEIESVDNNTATGKFIDVQPVEAKLADTSEAAETMEAFITDMVGQLLYGTSYNGCSISYGKRFTLEAPDTIWEKLQKARKDGAPTSALYDLYDDYLQSRYSANSLELIYWQKLAKIEPLPFVTYADASSSGLPQTILTQKYWFEKWIKGKTQAEILYGDIKALMTEFDAFCVENQTKLQEDTLANAQAMAQVQGAADTSNEEDPKKAGAGAGRGNSNKPKPEDTPA